MASLLAASSLFLSSFAFEEFAVLVEVLDRVGIVGAGTLHELLEVIVLARLGLFARSVDRSDQGWVGWALPILLVLLAPLHGGAFIPVFALSLALIPPIVEDRPDHLLARGVICSDVEQLAGGPGLDTSELVY